MKTVNGQKQFFRQEKKDSSTGFYKNCNSEKYDYENLESEQNCEVLRWSLYLNKFYTQPTVAIPMMFFNAQVNINRNFLH